jgi:large subunit ribosomal protein L18
MSNLKITRRLRIKRGIRKTINGTSQRPRLAVYKSNTSIYAQLIDDNKGHTIVAASSKEIGSKGNANVEVSKNVGKIIAEKAKEQGIEAVVFDRSGYLYHGKVKALADGAREGGLKF